MGGRQATQSTDLPETPWLLRYIPRMYPVELSQVTPAQHLMRALCMLLDMS